MWFKSFSEKQLSWLIALAIFLLMTISIGLRFQYTSHHNVIFGFDQARDAIVVRQLWNDRDIKIQGPSASGTNDSVYHGVFYYYFLAPLYAISQGDPQFPTFMITVWCVVLGFPAIYLLTKSVSSSRAVGLALVFLTAFSTQSIGYSAVLTNPILAYPFIPLFYLCLWKIFFTFSNQKRYLFLLGLSFGFLIHSALWFAPFGIAIVLGLYYRYYQKPQSLKSLATVNNAIIFLFPLSTLLFTLFFVQLRMWQAGIFTLVNLRQGSIAHQVSDFSAVLRYLDLFFRKLTESFFPSQALWLFILIPIFILALKLLQKKQQYFIGLLLITPLMIGWIQARANDQFFLGLEIVFYLLICMVVAKMTFPFKSFIVGLALLLFVFSNHKQMQYLMKFHAPIYEYPASRSYQSNLEDAISLVDDTYAHAQGRPFSISSIASPFKYNTVWSYLYSWHGMKKYGYVPSFWGDTQAGLVNEGLLPEVAQPLPIHFSITQANHNMEQNYLDDYYSIQARAAGIPTDFAMHGKNILHMYPIATQSSTLTTP